MVPTTTLLSVLITLFVSLVLPVLLLLIFGVKYRKQGIVSAVAAVSAFIIRDLCRRWKELEVSHAEA